MLIPDVVNHCWSVKIVSGSGSPLRNPNPSMRSSMGSRKVAENSPEPAF